MKNSKEISEIVRKYYKIDCITFQSKTRKREVVQARQLASKLSKENTKETLEVIGFYIGKKDHATVLHSIKTANNLIETDSKIKKDYEHLQDLIDAHYHNEITEEEIREAIKSALINRFAFRINQIKYFKNIAKTINSQL